MGLYRLAARVARAEHAPGPSHAINYKPWRLDTAARIRAPRVSASLGAHAQPRSVPNYASYATSQNIVIPTVNASSHIILQGLVFSHSRDFSRHIPIFLHFHVTLPSPSTQNTKNSFCTMKPCSHHYYRQKHSPTSTNISWKSTEM